MDDDTKAVLFLSGIATSIGALTGLALSFTALSPLVMGGIVAAVPITLCFVLCMLNEGVSKEQLFLSICFSAASAAIGVGLAAATMAIFPGATLGIGSAVSRCSNRSNRTNCSVLCNCSYKICSRKSV